jgi:hypothetical protein
MRRGSVGLRKKAKRSETGDARTTLFRNDGQAQMGNLGEVDRRSSSDAFAGSRSSFGSFVLRYIDPIATGHFGTMLYHSILGRGLPCLAEYDTKLPGVRRVPSLGC